MTMKEAAVLNEEMDQEMDEWLEDDGVEAMGVMTEFLKLQQQAALELTQLVLEYGKEEKITKEYIFNLFTEASEHVVKQSK